MTEHEAFGRAYHEAHARYPDPDNWYDIAVYRWWQAACKWQRDELLTAGDNAPICGLKEESPR